MARDGEPVPSRGPAQPSTPSGAPPSEVPEDIAALSYEAAYARLEVILARIEAPSTPLEEAIGLYEEGMLLATRCQDALADVELRLKKVDARGRTTDLTL
jgi:exodeoxyribonuclease VII small subunit